MALYSTKSSEGRKALRVAKSTRDQGVGPQKGKRILSLNGCFGHVIVEFPRLCATFD